jgi:hypothetical protein
MDAARLTAGKVIAGMYGGLEYLERFVDSNGILSESNTKEIKALELRLGVLYCHLRQNRVSLQLPPH